MNKLILFLVSLGCWAQSNLSTPAQILPPASGATGGSLYFDDSTTLQFVGLIAPTTIPTIVISSATAANPMVLTFATAPTVSTGSVIVISGALGVGCSVMNGPQTVTVASGTSVTISLNGTGCTYTGSSAKGSTAFWTMPTADAVGCVKSNGASQLSVSACDSSVTFVSSNPSGACTNVPPIQYNYTNGELWACEALTWTHINSGSSLPVSDATEIVYAAADSTKGIKFNASALTTGNVRTLSAQDANYTVAGTDIVNTFTQQQLLLGGLQSGTGSVILDIPLPGSGTITVRVPPTGATGAWNFTIPPTSGTSGYVLYDSDGAGTTNWTSVLSLIPVPFVISYAGGGASILGTASTTTGGIGIEGQSTAPSGYGGYFIASGSGSSVGVYATAQSAGGTAGYFYNGPGTSNTVAALYAQSDAGGSGQGPALQIDGTVIGSIIPTTTNTYFLGNSTDYYNSIYGVNYYDIGSPFSMCFTCAWTSYTPTVTGLSATTIDAKYNCQGKTCRVRISVVGTGGGSFPTFTLPTAATNNFTVLAGALMVSGSYQQSMCAAEASTTVLTAQFASASGLTNTYFCEGVYEAN